MRHGQIPEGGDLRLVVPGSELEFEVEGRSTLGLSRSGVPRMRFGLCNPEFCIPFICAGPEQLFPTLDVF